jgi:hypothetical protein
MFAEHIVEKREAKKALSQTQNQYQNAAFDAAAPALREQRVMGRVQQAPQWVDEKRDWASVGLNGGNRRGKESFETLGTAPPDYRDVMKEA